MRTLRSSRLSGAGVATSITMLVLSAVLALLTLPVTPAPALAEGVPAATAHSAPPAASALGPTDAQELEAFLDRVITQQMADEHIVGVTVAVVKDGRLFFAKGYGQADRERGTPVVADQTLFRVGSVAKPVTGTAVMQLVEQGRLDLHADINTYLKEFQVPATYPQPITLAHLLTHTAGFEEKGGLYARTAAELEPLGPYLQRTLPARVRPPGELAAYSNHGVALAGYIVAQAAGMPYEQYVDEHILWPLGMRHSTARQPVPPELAADLARGYTYTNGTDRAEPFEYVQTTPAGALSATATDMASFMIAHLQEGRFDGTRLLQAATAQEMHRRHFTNDPRLGGLAYTFTELTQNNQRLLLHGGDTDLFHATLALLPEHQVGLFVVNNTLGGAAAPPQLLAAFLDRYYPAPAVTAPRPPADFPARADRFTGIYMSSRLGNTTLIKVAALVGPPVSVGASTDGYLVIAGLAPAPTRWVEVEPLLFQQVDSQDRLAFRADSQGHITHLFAGPVAFERGAWHDAPALHVGVLGLAALVFLSALLLWPSGGLVRRRRGAPRSGALHLARWLAGATGALFLVFLLGLALALALLDERQFNYGLPPLLAALLALALLATALTVGVVVGAGLAWRRRAWGVLGRVHYTLLALAALACVWELHYWNLLGFRF